MYGSPWLKIRNFLLLRNQLQVKDPFLNGKLCYGKDLRQFPEIKGKLDLSFVGLMRIKILTKSSRFLLKNLWFDTLAGTDELGKQIISGTQKQKLENLGKKI